jgi:uncharacterized protein
MVMSGPLLAAGERTMIGSFFLFDADNIGNAPRFSSNERVKACLWRKACLCARSTYGRS